MFLSRLESMEATDSIIVSELTAASVCPHDQIPKNFSDGAIHMATMEDFGLRRDSRKCRSNALNKGMFR